MPFPAVVDLDDIAAGVGGYKIRGESADDFAGFSVSAAGDLNGDGIDDLVVGAPFNGGTSPEAGAGAAYVIFGRATAPAGPVDLGALAAGAGFKIQGEHPGDAAGFSVSAAGDVNGDGIDDLIVGAPFNYNREGQQVDEGAAYVVLGSRGGFTSPIDLVAIAAGTGGFKIEGADALENAGFSVSAAGDLNGDGFDDLVVGAPFMTFPGVPDYAGAAYVIVGNAGGLTSPVELGGFFVTRILGESSESRTGASVSGVGDVNGDGFNDLVIGAYDDDGGGTSAGAAYVVLGGTGRFGGLSDAIRLADIAGGTGGFKIQGENAGDLAGFSVSGTGDVNGDGVDDLVVGAPFNGSGAAYVVFGKDRDRGETFAATLDLDEVAAGTGGFKIRGEATGDLAGYSVSSAGDVNGDGMDDLIVGASGNTSGGSYAGAAYVVFGKAGGFVGPVDLAAVAAGSGGFKIQGENAYDRAGLSVSAAGDVNGDGVDDLVVGAFYNGSDGIRAGAAYVVLGIRDPLFTAGDDVRDLDEVDLSLFPGSRATQALAGNDIVSLSETQNIGVLFVGNAGDDTITGSSKTDRIRGDAGSDTLFGRGGDDSLWGTEDSDRLDGGNGNDHLNGGNDADSLFGGNGDDEAYGGNGNDTVSGGQGGDTLHGGPGDDTLIGGAGQDVLTGGVGADRFRFDFTADSRGDEVDRITDFTAGDRIDLSRIDAIPGGADDAFTFVTGGFTGPGQVRVTGAGGDTLILANTIGVGSPELTILLTGLVQVSQADLLL